MGNNVSLEAVHTGISYRRIDKKSNIRTHRDYMLFSI